MKKAAALALGVALAFTVTEGDSGVSYNYFGVNTTANTIKVSAAKSAKSPPDEAVRPSCGQAT